MMRRKQQRRLQGSMRVSEQMDNCSGCAKLCRERLRSRLTGGRWA
ncbi:hypothetical protein [Azospirillum doebereinerae]